MSLVQHTCVTLVCDGCSENAEGFEGQIVHFESPEQARKSFEDWWFFEGRDLCPDCALRTAEREDGPFLRGLDERTGGAS